METAIKTLPVVTHAATDAAKNAQVRAGIDKQVSKAVFGTRRARVALQASTSASAKADAVKAIQANKAASKAKPRTHTAPQASSSGIKFAMLQGYRPSGGAALFAHTAAALELLGMDKGASIPKARLASILGDTAVKHHLNKTGFLAQDEAGVTISTMGKDAFLMRHVDPELKAAFVEILTSGKTGKALPATYTNPKGIKAI